VFAPAAPGDPTAVAAAAGAVQVWVWVVETVWVCAVYGCWWFAAPPVAPGFVALVATIRTNRPSSVVSRVQPAGIDAAVPTQRAHPVDRPLRGLDRLTNHAERGREREGLPVWHQMAVAMDRHV